MILDEENAEGLLLWAGTRSILRIEYSRRFSAFGGKER